MNIFRNLFGNDKNAPELSPRNWREAAQQSGYGLKMDAPKMPRGMKLCTHLGVSGTTRRALQALLVRYWTVRPEYLVEEFMQIASTSKTPPQFPPEIETSIRSRHNHLSGESLAQEVTSTYIRHEMKLWKITAGVERAASMGVTYIRIRSCEDQRVCEKCAHHHNVIYPLDDAPIPPICWECRCYAEPLVDVDFIQWPAPVYHRGKVREMTKKQFLRISK